METDGGGGNEGTGGRDYADHKGAGGSLWVIDGFIFFPCADEF